MAMRSHGIAGTSARGRSSGSFGTGTSFDQDDMGAYGGQMLYMFGECGNVGASDTSTNALQGNLDLEQGCTVCLITSRPLWRCCLRLNRPRFVLVFAQKNGELWNLNISG